MLVVQNYQQHQHEKCLFYERSFDPCINDFTTSSELLKKTTAGPENSDFNFQFQQPPPVYYTSGGGNPGPPQVQDVVTVTSTGSTTTQPPSSKGRKSSKNNVSNFNMPLL